MNNILFIMADQFRYDTLGFLGHFPVRTPNLDQLAAEGTVFRNAYTPNPVCVPARASLMTGRHSFDHGVYYNDQNWPDAMPTWVENLSGNCYYTTCVGKTHFHPPRKAAGFQKLVLPEDHAQYLNNRGLVKKRKGSIGKTKDRDYLIRSYPIEPTHVPMEHYEPVYFTNQAIGELERIAQRRHCGSEGQEPFMMKLSYQQPHSPCTPPEPYFSMYQPEDLPPPHRSQEELETFPCQVRHTYDIWKQLPDDRALKHRAQYMGCVTLVDELIGQVIAKLKALNLYDNTLIVFTSDHGDHLCDHHLQQKGYFWESSVRVPLIMRGPGAAVGHQVNDPVSLLDLYPTFMQFCDLDMPRWRDSDGKLIYADMQERDSVSLMPYLAGGDDIDPDRIIISENAIHGQRIMLKKGNMKVNYYINDGAENEWDYFDLSDDPHELNNKGGSFSMKDLAPDMREQLDRVLKLARRHADGHYYFQDRVRPMFT